MQNSFLEIAKENILVVKHSRTPISSIFFFSSIYRYRYILYVPPPIIHMRIQKPHLPFNYIGHSREIIEKGYHSYDLSQYSWYNKTSDKKRIAGFFIIPKGAIYFEGNQYLVGKGLVKGYCSNRLIYLGKGGFITKLIARLIYKVKIQHYDY